MNKIDVLVSLAISQAEIAKIRLADTNQNGITSEARKAVQDLLKTAGELNMEVQYYRP